jgi:molybdopterin molybdotransferase
MGGRMRSEQTEAMISVEDALDRIMPQFHALEPETIGLSEALERVLAEDVYSDSDIPPFPSATMDGYAVRSADLAVAGPDHPVTLTVVGSVAAGQVTDTIVETGAAIRIMTGAPMPLGSDAVARFEQTDGASVEARTHVQVFASVRPDENVRAVGEDLRRGALGLASGTVIHPAEIGLLAALGKARIAVVRRPRVAILASGDELVGIEEPLAPGRIRSSNEYAIAAQVQRYGGIPVALGIARDNLPELGGKIQAGIAHGVDLIITLGGVSVGDYDLVKTVLKRDGQLHFWRVRMSPGKSIAFGAIAGVPVLGLPGTPSATMVSFEQFARPVILTMLGRTRCMKLTVEAVLEKDVRNRGLRGFVPVALHKTVSGWSARPTREPGSGVLTSMVRAHGLAVIPEDVRLVRAGERLQVQMLNWPEQGSGDIEDEVIGSPLA